MSIKRERLDKLRLVRSSRTVIQELRRIQPNNFWNTCGKQAESMHDDCECVTLGAESDWFINAPEYRNCFWRWVAEKSLPNGEMKPLFQHEIAEFLECSPTKVHFTIKESVEKLKQSEYLPYLAEALSGDVQSESGSDGPNLDAIFESVDGGDDGSQE